MQQHSRFEKSGRFYLPKVRVLGERRPPAPKQHVRMLGPQEMFWQIIEGNDVVREAESPVHNIVLTNSLDLAASYGFTGQANYAVVGTGSSTPAASQTGLDNEVARTNYLPDGETVTVTRNADGDYTFQVVREFTEAEVGGQNLTEWGFSGGGTAGNNLMSRELFRDGSGNPITITLASDQKLRLIYATRFTVGPVTATATDLTISGYGTVSGKSIAFKSASIFGLTQGAVDIYTADMVAKASNGTPFSRYIPSGDPGYELNLYLMFWITSSLYTADYNTNAAAQSAGTMRSIDDGNLPFNAYTSGSYQRTISSALFGTTEANYNIASIGFAVSDSSTESNRGFGWAWIANDSNNTINKDNLHKIDFSGWGISWSAL